MKKLLMIVLLLNSVFFTTTFAQAQTVQDAIKGLKKLEAKCQAGISYSNYREALGDTQFEVNQYIENDDAKKDDELKTYINLALSHYKYAATVWSYKFKESYVILRTGEIFDKDLEDRLIKNYPKTQEDVNNGGATVTKRMFLLSEKSMIIDFVLPIIWSEASDSLKKANQLLLEINHSYKNRKQTMP